MAVYSEITRNMQNVNRVATVCLTKHYSSLMGQKVIDWVGKHSVRWRWRPRDDTGDGVTVHPLLCKFSLMRVSQFPPDGGHLLYF